MLPGSKRFSSNPYLVSFVEGPGGGGGTPVWLMNMTLLNDEGPKGTYARAVDSEISSIKELWSLVIIYM